MKKYPRRTIGGLRGEWPTANRDEFKKLLSLAIELFREFNPSDCPQRWA